MQQFPIVTQSFNRNRADLTVHPGVGLGAPGTAAFAVGPSTTMPAIAASVNSGTARSLWAQPRFSTTSFGYGASLAWQKSGANPKWVAKRT